MSTSASGGVTPAKEVPWEVVWQAFDELRLGRVAAYDAAAGLGVLEDTESAGGAESAQFHCTAIADGSRQIDVGTLVVFVLVPGLGGRVEARAVTAIKEAIRSTATPTGLYRPGSSASF